MRLDHLVLVEQRQATRRFKHTLNDEHDVGTPGVVLVETQSDVVLQRPWQNAVAEFGNLHALANNDRILADQIDAADMAVEIDTHAGPIQPRGDLLDMSRFAGAVIAGDDNPAVAGKAGQDGKRGRAVEPVVRIEFGDVLLRFGIGWNLQISIDSEYLSDRNLHIRQAGFSRRISRERHCSSVTSAGPRRAVRGP